jgi:uncharacterized protein
MRYHKITIGDEHVYYLPDDMSLRFNLPEGQDNIGHVAHQVDHEREKTNQLTVVITNRCNMSCSYCYANASTPGESDKQKAKIDMTPDEVAAIIKASFSDKSNIRLHLIGGEPFVNKDTLKRAVLECEKKALELGSKCSLSVSTNGSLISEEDALFLKEHDVHLRVEFDGIRSVHDKYRCYDNKRGSYDQVVRSLTYLKQNLCSYSVVSVMTPSALVHLRDVYDGIVEYNPSAIRFSPLLTDTSGSLDEGNYDGSAYGKELKGLISRMVQGDDFLQIMRLKNVATYLPYIHKRIPRTCGCPARYGWSRAIDVDGAVYPCVTLIGRNASNIHFNAGLDASSGCSCERGRHDCNNCWAYELCGGGCLFDERVRSSDSLYYAAQLCGLIKAEIAVAIETYCRLYRHKIIH